MMNLFPILATVAATALLAYAHGGAWSYTADGTSGGNLPEARSAFRPNRNPTFDVDYPYLACNNNGVPTTPSTYASVEAGGVVDAHYDKDFPIPGEPTGNPEWNFWSHRIGPMLAYLAECGESCEDLDITAPIWFKIHEVGLLNGTWVDGYWGQMDVYAGAPFSIPVPKALKPGKYLLRHEIIAFETPPQIFVECAQLEVKGSGSAIPGPEYGRVAFPGGYDLATNPGLNLTTEDVFITHANDTYYPMPGPAVWNPAM